MCCKDWKVCWRSGRAFSTYAVAKMGCADSREETKRLDEDKKEDDAATRNAKSVLAYAFSLGLQDVTEGRPYKLNDGQNYDLMQNLAANWVTLHQRVDKKAIPFPDVDEEADYQDTGREKETPLMDEEEKEEVDGEEERSEDMEQKGIDAVDEESLEEENSGEDLEEARPGLGTILGRR